MNTTTVNSTTSDTTTGNTTAAQNNATDMIPGTNWTYSDAASMAKECLREERLFGSKGNKTRRPRRTLLTATQRAARFVQETGWTMADALSEAIECRRDRRLYGQSLYAQV
jgi:hypothetical protein